MARKSLAQWTDEELTKGGLPAAQAAAVWALCEDEARLAASPVHAFMDLLHVEQA